MSKIQEIQHEVDRLYWLVKEIEEDICEQHLSCDPDKQDTIDMLKSELQEVRLRRRTLKEYIRQLRGNTTH